MIEVVWPDILRPKSVMFDLDGPSRSGGASTSGAERIVWAGSVRWKATMSFQVWGSPSAPDLILAWRAIKAQTLGRVGHILIGPHDWMTPAHLDGRSTTFRSPHSDGTPHSDGSLYRQPSSTAVVTADMPLRSSSVSITPVEDWPPRAGQYFGIGADQLYLIASVRQTAADAYVLAFAPPLRASIAAGDLLDFEDPRARMRFASDDTGALQIDAPWMATPSLDLVEVY